MKRSRNYLIAAILAGVLALGDTVVALATLPQGAHQVNHAHNQPPYVVLLIEVVIGLIGLVAAYGVFRSLRWAVILTVALMVVNVLVSLPGIPFGPTTFDKVGSVVGLVLSAAVLYFLLRRDSRANRQGTPVTEAQAELTI
jgi:hypothetical protein